MKSKIVTATLALCCLSPSFSYAQSTAPTIADEVIFTLSSETLTSPRAVVEHSKADFIQIAEFTPRQCHQTDLSRWH